MYSLFSPSFEWSRLHNACTDYDLIKNTYYLNSTGDISRSSNGTFSFDHNVTVGMGFLVNIRFYVMSGQTPPYTSVSWDKTGLSYDTTFFNGSSTLVTGGLTAPGAVDFRSVLRVTSVSVPPTLALYGVFDYDLSSATTMHFIITRIY